MKEIWRIRCVSILLKDYRARTIQAATVGLTFILLLILPSSGLADPSPDSLDRLSTAFTQSATSALIAIYQSKQNIAAVVKRNLPSGYYNPDLAARAYDQVRQSEIAATTNGDQQAAILLNSYFMRVKAWADKYKAARQSMNATNTMGEDPLGQDSDWQAIESCEKALNTMLSKRVYNDIASCQ